MQSCCLETYAMVARSLLKKQPATKKVTSRTCTIYVCLRFKSKKNPLMIRPTWIIIQNRSKNTSLLPLRTLQPLSRGMLSSTEKHTKDARPEAVTKHVTYVPCLKRLKGITWTVASRKNVNVFGIYRYLEVFLCEYYRKRLGTRILARYSKELDC